MMTTSLYRSFRGTSYLQILLESLAFHDVDGRCNGRKKVLIAGSCGIRGYPRYLALSTVRAVRQDSHKKEQ
jgi:hypothetical protein